jgi:prepilin-type N-terminal cleavage/methylation domain-containing protein
MNIRLPARRNRARPFSGMSLIEMLITVLISSIVLTLVWILTVFAYRSFAAMGNYADLDGTSREALDLMGRELRQGSMVVAAQPTGPVKWLTVAELEEAPLNSVTNKYTWDSSTGLMVWDRWEGGAHTTRTNLTGCDLWSFQMYTRAPDTGGVFQVTTDLARCKLINMNWRCSRQILGKKVNTETVLTAQVVLRNKQSN